MYQATFRQKDDAQRIYARMKGYYRRNDSDLVGQLKINGKVINVPDGQEGMLELIARKTQFTYKGREVE